MTTAIEESKKYLEGMEEELEVKVDAFDDAVWRLGMLGRSAEGTAGEALKIAERVLGEREEVVRREVGTMGLGVREVLRSLSRMEG